MIIVVVYIIIIFVVFWLILLLIFRGIPFLITRTMEGGGTVFHKGKINISIQRTSYAPGDTISGDVALTLKKPVEAMGVSIFLLGEEITSGGGGILEMILRRGSVTVKQQRRRIYDCKKILDGEKEYNGGREYHFEIKIPADIPQMPKPEGRPSQVQNVAKTATAIMGLTPIQETPEPEGKQNRWLKVTKKIAAELGLITLQRMKWYLLAKFDIPHGLDIKKRVEVTIR